MLLVQFDCQLKNKKLCYKLQTKHITAAKGCVHTKRMIQSLPSCPHADGKSCQVLYSFESSIKQRLSQNFHIWGKLNWRFPNIGFSILCSTWRTLFSNVQNTHIYSSIWKLSPSYATLS